MEELGRGQGDSGHLTVPSGANMDPGLWPYGSPEGFRAAVGPPQPSLAPVTLLRRQSPAWGTKGLAISSRMGEVHFLPRHVGLLQ